MLLRQEGMTAENDCKEGVRANKGFAPHPVLCDYCPSASLAARATHWRQGFIDSKCAENKRFCKTRQQVTRAVVAKLYRYRFCTPDDMVAVCGSFGCTCCSCTLLIDAVL